MTQTTCPYCGVGCGVQLEADTNGWTLRGDRDHPANRGALCSKGSALAETLSLESRLLYPHLHGQRIDWETALSTLSERLSATLQQYGPEAVGLYVSGQCLTEDYYVANKLMKGFIGSANLDTNSRLCMASSVVGHKRAFGSDTVPGLYEDLDQAELVVLVGSNLAWCHPVLYQRLLKASRRPGGPRFVVIDPRRTASCDGAWLHLPLQPGTDVTLFNALLVALDQAGQVATDWVAAHTEGFEAALEAAKADAPSLEVVAERCGIAQVDLEAFLNAFCATEQVVTVYSQGVNQSSSGSDKVNAILNCHLATARIGRPGCGPFSVTGQPNAMGGREVGGLANQLAAHMDFAPDDIDRVGRFWQAPNMVQGPGKKAVDLFRAVAEGEIRFLWIMATNPVVSLPEADAVRAAIAQCDFVVVSDIVDDTDTVALADLCLPALGWGEKSGTVTNSERCISRQRAFLPAPGEARADWAVLAEVGQRLGHRDAFTWTHPAEVFREHAALSAFENAGRRDFDIGALSDLDDEAYDALQPCYWPLRREHSTPEAQRFFADGQFFTPNRRARLLALRQRTVAHPVDADYPLVLNSGRLRDQWHTMTRTARAPRLNGHFREPCLHCHPKDVAGWAEGSLVQIESRWGQAVLRLRLDAAQRPGQVFVPMHWGAPYATLGRIGAVVNPALDPYSGQPESKHTPVRLRLWQPRWQGFALLEKYDGDAGAAYCVRSRGKGHWLIELADHGQPLNGDWLLHQCGAVGEMLEYRDEHAGCYRYALLENERLLGILFIGREGSHLPSREALATAIGQAVPPHRRLALLAGESPTEDASGPLVCACFEVGRTEIERACREHDLTTSEAIGQQLKAGTNCGSCVPELRAILASMAAPA